MLATHSVVVTMISSCLLCCQVVCLNAYVRSQMSGPGFYHSRVLSDGEREKRVHWKKVTAIETTVEFPSNPQPPSYSPTNGNYDTNSNEIRGAIVSNHSSSNTADFESSGASTVLPTSHGLVLRQVTDGRHFIQLIYDSGWELRDCEYLRDKETVRKFLSKLTPEFACARVMSSHTNDTSSSFNQIDSSTCDFLKNDSNFQLLKARKMSELPTEISSLTNYRDLKRQCYDLHQRIREIYESRSTKGQAYGYHQQQQVGFLDRIKRDLFLYPGTNWCGSGNSGRKFNDLGYNAAADRCCRDHDHCPFTIEAFTEKFNFFNYRFHTISHCDCDERFRACLKLADTAPSNMVGKLFFNVVQTKCFNFRAVKVCAKRSWWGKCLKHEKQKTAHLKDALAY